jgi:hypothetical protein
MTEEITAGGVTIPISNAGKVLFPDDGITKKDLARYYADVPAGPAGTWPARLRFFLDRWRVAPPSGTGALRVGATLRPPPTC